MSTVCEFGVFICFCEDEIKRGVERGRESGSALTTPLSMVVLASPLGRKSDLGTGPPRRTAEGPRDLEFRMPHIKLYKFDQCPASFDQGCYGFVSNVSDLGERWLNLRSLVWDIRKSRSRPEAPRRHTEEAWSQVIGVFGTGWVVNWAVKRGAIKTMPLLTTRLQGSPSAQTPQAHSNRRDKWYVYCSTQRILRKLLGAQRVECSPRLRQRSSPGSGQNRLGKSGSGFSKSWGDLDHSLV